MVRYFAGRSESDIKNRWYSHLKYCTLTNGKTIVLAHQSQTQWADRKKRNRSERNPKQAASLLLAQEMQCNEEVEAGNPAWAAREPLEDMLLYPSEFFDF
jgi:hypothetical protein